MELARCRAGKTVSLLLMLLTLLATGGCKQSAWPLWNAYKARFIDEQGRVIDHTAGDRTTSEGEAYALFFALASNDRTTFDRLLGWTQANLAANDLSAHLPAWLWGKSKTGEWKTLDPGSAADADAWMAYTLLEAGRLWNSPQYTRLGRGLLAEIAKSEVADLPGFGAVLMPGPAGFKHGQTWTLNPSYTPVFLFDRLAYFDAKGPWRKIAVNLPRLLDGSARHGFVMDWVNYTPGDGFAPTPPIHTGNQDSEIPGGSYDAIRVYLWAGMMDARDKLRGPVLNAIPAMDVYLANREAPPEKVGIDGIPMGQDGPVGFSAALAPYLRAYPEGAKVSARQAERMEKMRDPSTGLYGKDLAYYDQNLALFSSGFLEGRFRFGSGGELTVQWER